jgi:hypothetical protein
MHRLRSFAALFVVVATLVPHASHADVIVVAHDLADDWGANFDTTVAPLGDALGQELIGAAIENDAPGHVNFIIQLKSLPASGGVPELSRYFWDFTVNGTLRELDGKFTNYSRGACDPTSGQCPPPRDPGAQPFLVRGNCASNGAAVVCEEIGLVHATFDVAAATITIPVSAELLGYTGCAEIAPADDGFGGMLTAVPSAFLSEPAGPWDSLVFDDEIESVEVC